MNEQSLAKSEEIAEKRRKCWASGCNRTSRLEWCGWRYCLRHYWVYVLKGQSSWQHLLVKIRFTRIVKHYKMKSRQEIKRRLVKGVYGNFSEWRQACEEAKANGWTQDEVEHVLNVYHPSTWLFLAIILVLVLLYFC